MSADSDVSAGRQVLLLVESGDWRRVWEEVVPLLNDAEVQVTAGSVFPRGPVHDQWRRLGWESFSLNCHTSRGYPLAALRLRRIVARRRVRLIHAGETIPAFIGGLATYTSRRRISIFHRQHTEFDNHPSLTRLSRMASRLTDYTLACSQAAADYAHELDGVDRDRIRIAYNGANRHRDVTDEELQEIRRRIGAAPDGYIVPCVARLRPEKGLDVFVRALHELQRHTDRRLHGVVVGDGPCRQATEELARDLAVPVFFAGHQDDVAPWFAAADVVAMPSRREPFGVVGAEAMSAGKPLVASRVDGLAELVGEGDGGVLVPPDDPAALAEALRQLLGDPDERSRLGAVARERFERYFTNEAMVNAWLRCWDEVLAAT